MLSRTVSAASSPDVRMTAGSRWISGAFLLFLFAASAVAQTTAGRILGTVSDQTGAAVGGATVVVTDVQRGTSRTLTTDDFGEYVAPQLLPGNYKIHVEAKGFKASERPNIGVEVATDVRADFTLQPGQVSQVVVVEDAVPLVNTTSSTMGGTLSNQEINDLPLSGRNYENLLQLRPGVIRYPGGGFSTTSANGLRAEDNGYYIEGLFDSEPYSGQSIVNGAGIAGDSATILPIDAIQEFNLQSNLPAEYGYKPGAVVNVGLKSGTNKVHGTAFGFGRDGALDARNFFNADPNPKLTRTLEQFGGSLGGPLVKDKAFFFGAYEGQRYNVGNSFGGITSPSMVPMTLVPTAAPDCTSLGPTVDCADSIPNAIADLQASGVAVDAASLNIAGCTLSGATVTCAGTGFPLNNAPSISITNGFNNVVHVDNVVAKLDYRLSDQHSISGTYFFGNNSGTVEDFPELQQKWLSDIHTRAQVVGGNWIWTPNARWVNELRAGYNRLYQPTLPGDLNTPASSYGLNTGVTGPETGGLPRIGFGGYFFPGLGGFKWPKFQGPDSITQFVDQVTYSMGKHSMKFGGDLHYNKVTNAAYGNARGSITFLGGVAIGTGAGSTPLEDFLAGLPFKSSIEVGNPTLHLHNWAYAGFFQDDWRATKNLTVNFGVRYEFSTVPQEANNLLGNFDPNVGMVQVGHGISSLYNPYHKSFGPRGGFAWDILGNGRTVLRGGGGLMYETVNWQSFVAFNNAFGPGSVPTGAPIDAAGDTSGGTITTGNATVKNFLNPAPWDTAGTPLYGGGTINCFLSPCPIMTVDRNLTTPYVWNWTLNLQHAFTQNVSMELAYVGNRGSNLTGIRDINQPPVGSGWPAANVAGCNQPSDLVNGQYDTGNVNNNGYCQVAPEVGPFTQFPYLANIFQMGNVYRSNYNALQVTLNARNYHGLNMVAGYTYSHALDDVGANWDFGYGSGLPQNAHNPGAEYANSDFDLRHRLTISLTYAIPGRKGYGQMAEGWEINTITTLETPQYWGPMDEGTDAAGVGPLPTSPPANTPIRWSFYGKTSDFKSQKGVGLPYFPGNNMPSDPSGSSACNAQALAVDGGTPGASTESLAFFGCYANGNSVMLPPPLGQFGNMRRNMFQDTGFKNFDFSVGKNFHFGEAMRLQFRVEFFNIFNHPNFANPYGGQNGFGLNDPSVQPFGCGCATPDIAAANPAIGSGGPRSIQLGAKFVF